MSIREQMLLAVRSAKRRLGERREQVVHFLHDQINPDGGFKDRSGKSDLYYTMFGYEALAGLEVEPPRERMAHFLATIPPIDSLDFIELCCVVRFQSAMGKGVIEPAIRDEILERLNGFRSGDGGYHINPGSERGTAYGCFMALGALQELGMGLSDQDKAGLLNCVAGLKTGDGGYTNESALPMGMTPAAAAVLTILQNLGQPVDKQCCTWLLSQCRAEGGFTAMPLAPEVDLLSTATALHGLALSHASIESIREPCLKFVEGLLTESGGFKGHVGDETVDCEYTYYGLLALGHLGKKVVSD